MPNGKYRKSKRTFRKTTRRRPARRAPVVRRMVRREISRTIEPKYLTTTYNVDAVSNQTGTFSLLNGCAQGTDRDDRIGRKCQFKGMSMALSVNNGGAAPIYFRSVVVIDRYPQGAALVIGDIYDTTALFFTDRPLRNLDNVRRFKIIFDRTVRLSTIASDDYAGRCQLSSYKRLYLTTQYDDSNNADITDIKNGALYHIYAASTVDVTLNGMVRLMFHDA